MLLAQHLERTLSLDPLMTTANANSAMRVGILTLAGWLALAAMSLPIVSLPGLGMLAAAMVLTWIIREAERMQAEADTLNQEHSLQLEMADQLMLTPPSIKS